MSCFFRESWLQNKSVSNVRANQLTPSCKSWYHETPFWAFTKVFLQFFYLILCLFSSLRTDKWMLTNKLILYFILSQGHSIWRGQSHDCAECGDRVRPDAAWAGDGGSQHRHAHGLSEPDRGAHPERIRTHLLLQLKSATCLPRRTLSSVSMCSSYSMC